MKMNAGSRAEHRKQKKPAEEKVEEVVTAAEKDKKMPLTESSSRCRLYENMRVKKVLIFVKLQVRVKTDEF